MTKTELNNIWNYHLVLDRDMDATSRFVEPTQKGVYSFEFQKLIILCCTEIENVFKLICQNTSGANTAAGNMREYKEVILTYYPKIVEAEVSIPRLSETLRPFDGWSSGPLPWWNVYQDIKHHRITAFNNATCWNAICCLSALYILIFYLAQITQLNFESCTSKYIDSDYSSPFLLDSPEKTLPDFQS